MKTITFLIIPCTVLLFFFAGLSSKPDALAGPAQKKKTDVLTDGPSLIGLPDVTEKVPGPGENNREKPSPKKKAIKKAGTAAAVGVAGSKVKSALKDDGVENDNK